MSLADSANDLMNAARAEEAALSAFAAASARAQEEAGADAGCFEYDVELRRAVYLSASKPYPIGLAEASTSIRTLAARHILDDLALNISDASQRVNITAERVRSFIG